MLVELLCLDAGSLSASVGSLVLTNPERLARIEERKERESEDRMETEKQKMVVAEQKGQRQHEYNLLIAKQDHETDLFNLQRSLEEQVFASLLLRKRELEIELSQSRHLRAIAEGYSWVVRDCEVELQKLDQAIQTTKQLIKQ